MKWYLTYGLMIIMVVIVTGNVIATPRTIYVDVNHDGTEAGTEDYPYDTLQEGINSAIDGAGDTLRIAGGYYYETVLISFKSDLTMKPNQTYDDVCIDHYYSPSGSGTNGRGLDIEYCDNLIIEDIEVRNTDGDGIYIEESDNIKFDSLYVHDCTFTGLKIYNCDKVKIDHCHFLENGNHGVYINRLNNPLAGYVLK